MTTKEAQQALDDYNDIQNALNSDPSLENIAEPLEKELRPLFSSSEASKDAHHWNKAWKESTKETDSDADDTLMNSYTNAFSQASSTVTGEFQTVQSEAKYIGDQLQEFFGEQGNICQSETSGVIVMVNNENTN